MRAVIVAGPLAAGDKFPEEGGSLSAAADSVHIAHAALSACGLHKTKVVPIGTASHAVLLTTDTVKHGSAHTPMRVAYRENIVSALLPGGSVHVGSLAHLVPEISWVSDPGGMVLELPARAQVRGPLAASPWTQPAAPQKLAAARAPIAIKVRDLPKQPVSIRGPVRAVILDEPVLRGIPLLDGDTVVDGVGDRWFVEAAGDSWRLVSHKSASANRDAVTSERNAGARVIRPLVPNARLQHVKNGDPVEVCIGDERLYGTYSVDADAGWTIRVDPFKPLVVHPDSTCFGEPSANTVWECVEHGGIWDRPCATDTECPYYDERRHRGGCRDGICEMPLGVGNKTFRMADPETPALSLVRPSSYDGYALRDGGLTRRTEQRAAPPGIPSSNGLKNPTKDERYVTKYM